jgi:hypothetical protein
MDLLRCNFWGTSPAKKNIEVLTFRVPRQQKKKKKIIRFKFISKMLSIPHSMSLPEEKIFSEKNPE